MGIPYPYPTHGHPYMGCILLFSLRLKTYNFGSLSKFGGPIWKCCIKAKVLNSFDLANLGCGKCRIKAKGVLGFQLIEFRSSQKFKKANTVSKTLLPLMQHFLLGPTTLGSGSTTLTLENCLFALLCLSEIISAQATFPNMPHHPDPENCALSSQHLVISYF